MQFKMGSYIVSESLVCVNAFAKVLIATGYLLSLFAHLRCFRKSWGTRQSSLTISSFGLA